MYEHLAAERVRDFFLNFAKHTNPEPTGELCKKLFD